MTESTQPLDTAYKQAHAAPAPARRRVHRRSIVIDGFVRDDGSLELEAVLTDVKDVDYPISSGLRPAGIPVHEMRVRVVLDPHFTIKEAHAEMPWVPFVGSCDRAAARYEALVGLNLLRGFRQAVLERLGGVQGCTHLTELLMSLPTAAIQTWATFKKDNEDTGQKPFQLDQCLGLDTRHSEAVRRFYPKWWQGERKTLGPDEAVFPNGCDDGAKVPFL